MPEPRTVVITGASRGIGRLLCEFLRADGHDVVATCRDPDAVAEPIPARAVVELDVADTASVAGLAGRLAAVVDRVDVLVNNAGIKRVPGFPSSASAGPIPDLDPAAVLTLLRTNVVGPLLVTQAVVPMLRRPGAVVANISSQLASLQAGTGVDYAYNCSKAALNMATVTLQRDLADLGIAAVAISPGWLRTDMGGPDAPLDTRIATRELASLVGRLDRTFGGCYVDRFGVPIPW